MPSLGPGAADLSGLAAHTGHHLLNLDVETLCLTGGYGHVVAA